MEGILQPAFEDLREAYLHGKQKSIQEWTEVVDEARDLAAKAGYHFEFDRLLFSNNFRQLPMQVDLYLRTLDEPFSYCKIVDVG